MKKILLIVLLFALTACGGGGGAAENKPALPRFVDKGNGTIFDTTSNLTWLKDANCFGRKNWDDSIATVQSLASSQCGLTDSSVAGNWHLPTVDELRAFTDSGYRYNTLTSEGFSNVMSDFNYWSSTTRSSNTAEAWSVFLLDGAVESGSKNFLGNIWPVRN